MPRYPGRNYFVVRHDLASFRALPGFIWNSGEPPPPNSPPVGFRQVQKGDRWISFAYSKTEGESKAIREVTGFYESTVREQRYGKLPPRAQKTAQVKTGAWMIRGRPYGQALSDSVVIPPLSHFLGPKLFNRRTITRISPGQFREVERYVRKYQFKPKEIPGLGRHPRNEQEVLLLVASAPSKFGIERIIHAQTRFPDMLVKLKGKAEPVHLELEVYSSSFINHGHERQVYDCRFKGTRRAKGDGREVGVLCWVDDDQAGTVKKHVHRIYALQELLKCGQRIVW